MRKNSDGRKSHAHVPVMIFLLLKFPQEGTHCFGIKCNLPADGSLLVHNIPHLHLYVSAKRSARSKDASDGFARFSVWTFRCTHDITEGNEVSMPI